MENNGQPENQIPQTPQQSQAPQMTPPATMTVQEIPTPANSSTTSTPDPLPASPTIVMPTQAQHKSRFGLLFIILFMLGVLFLGGTYLFVISQKKTASSMPIVNKQAQIEKNVHQLEEQVPTDDSKNINGDFSQVDQEMKNL
jgi:hypothetical protein